jgi:peroxiredoxin
MLQTLLNLVLAGGVVVSASAVSLQFQLHDIQGAVHSPSEWAGQKAILLFFVIQDCAVVNSYVPEMNRIAKAYQGRGVRSYAVQADSSASLPVTAAYSRAYRYDFPLLMDPHQILVRLAGATVTPQAVILSPEGAVLYRGRIDNRIEDFGTQRPKATVQDLRDALDDVLAGRPPRVHSTRSIGCAITLLK